MTATLSEDSSPPPALRRALARVAGLNLGFFFVEGVVAVAIGSVALFADSVDFLEDAVLTAMVFLALGWSARKRAGVAFVLGLVMLIPSAAAAIQAFGKFLDPVPPAAVPLGITGFVALLVNAFCAWTLARHRASGNLMRAAWLSARNDVIAGVAIIAAAFLVAYTATPWPDVVVGLGILLLNGWASFEVIGQARRDWRTAAASG